MARAIIIQRDGNSLMAIFDDFINLQESPAGFGETEEAAITDLRHEAAIQGYAWPKLSDYEGGNLLTVAPVADVGR